MKKPEISIVMSCFNAEVTLRRAIDSMLNQTFQNFEFIIVDDGSSDNTGKILIEYSKSDPRIRIHENKENIGLAASLNKGIAMARSNFIARMDADDEALSHRLALQYEWLLKHENIDILGSAVIQRRINGEQIGIKSLPAKHEDIISRIFKKTLVFHPSLLIRKRVYDVIGKYDPDLKWAEDADLWYRIYDKVKFHNLEEPLLYYTIKEKLKPRQAWINLRVKFVNLERRKRLINYFPRLISDMLLFSYRVISRR